MLNCGVGGKYILNNAKLWCGGKYILVNCGVGGKYILNNAKLWCGGEIYPE